MSQRYHRGGTYQTRNPLAVYSPLRSLPTFRHPVEVFGTSWHDGTWNQPKAATEGEAVATPAPTLVDPVRELANAEASLCEHVRVYDFARKAIGAANATRTQEVLCNGRVVMAARPLTKERIREHRSYAFSVFNKRRGELARARRRVDAARAALGWPSLAVTEERAAVAVAARASKRRPVVHQIAFGAAAAG